jgi:hypothetical protein
MNGQMMTVTERLEAILVDHFRVMPSQLTILAIQRHDTPRHWVVIGTTDQGVGAEPFMVDVWGESDVRAAEFHGR